jgi:hypothetical protein
VGGVEAIKRYEDPNLCDTLVGEAKAYHKTEEGKSTAALTFSPARDLEEGRVWLQVHRGAKLLTNARYVAQSGSSSAW